MTPTFCNRCGDAFEFNEDSGCDLKEELAELDALLERLTLKRYDLKRKINRFYSPIVGQLPPDVMSTIFEFCLPDITDQFLSFSSYKPFTPLSLGAICSYWRDIAWSTPSLWSSLVVRDPSEYNMHIITGLAQEWLARSGRLPLSIRIISTFYNNTVTALANIINQYSARWSDLDLDIPDCYFQCFNATDNHAPILKSIRFQRSTTSKKVNLRLTCPRLEKATLSYFPLDGTNIQWDNLTHLALYTMSTIDSFLILRKTPRLVFCEISSSSFYSRRILEGEIIIPVLTSLKSLCLSYGSSTEDFLNNLIAPHLEDFSLRRYYPPSPIIEPEVVTSFLRRSVCSLRSLSMIFSIIPQYFEVFMNLLQSMPSLTTLSLLSITIFNKTNPEEYQPRNILQLVAKVLSSQSTSLQQGFLPNLKILEYTGKLHLHSGNYDDLYPLPPANNAARGPLHLLKLDLYPANRIPENMISYVSSLEERGVTVNVLSDSENILQSSIDYYKCRKDSLYRPGDWSDNLDSSLLS